MRGFKIVVDCGSVTLTMDGRCNEFSVVKTEKFLKFAENFFELEYAEEAKEIINDLP